MRHYDPAALGAPIHGVTVDLDPDLAALQASLDGDLDVLGVHNLEVNLTTGRRRYRHLPKAPAITEADRRYLFDDPALQARDLRMIRLPKAPQGQWVGTSDLFTPQEERNDPFFREFLAAQRISSFVTKARPVGPGRVFITYVTLHERSVGAPRQIEALKAYEVAAFGMARRRDRLAAAGVPGGIEGEALLSCDDLGVILLDGTGRVRLTNAAADAILARAEVLRVEGRGIRAAETLSDMQLQMWFHRLGRGAVPDGPLALRDRQGRRALTVALVPAAPSRVGDEPAARTFALLLKDAARSAPARVDRAVLAREFGFTPAECDEAELLVQGRDPAELCAILGLSPDTLRKRRQVMRAKLCLDPGVDLVGALRGFAFRLQ